MNIGSEVSCLPAIVMKETLFLAYTICQSGYAMLLYPSSVRQFTRIATTPYSTGQNLKRLATVMTFTQIFLKHNVTFVVLSGFQFSF